MEEVQIGKKVQLGHNVIIYPFTQISDNAALLDNAVIGKKPSYILTLKRKIDEVFFPCEIGEGSIIGTATITYAGIEIGKKLFYRGFFPSMKNVYLQNFICFRIVSF
jgi:UDP-2-acetamido-3-amino-2,3-dideoxy-glucuronate N-acetyltransferase